MDTEIKATNQRIELLPLANLEPSAYQRPTKDWRVRDIVNEFDEAKLGTLTVSYRDRKYYLVDGAHRSRVLRCLGYTHASCVVLTGLTYEMEAEYYRLQHENTCDLTPGDKLKGGIASKDELCVTVDKIVTANGFQIGKGNKDFYKIAAIKTLFTMAEDYGYAVLDETLFLIANTWAGIPRASSSECLLGVAEFVSRYGLASFAERLHDKFSLIWYEYTEAMRYQGSTGTAVSRYKFCRILVEPYNKGIVHNSKQRLKWEDERK